MEFNIWIIAHGHVDHELIICQINRISIFIFTNMLLLTFQKFF